MVCAFRAFPVNQNTIKSIVDNACLFRMSIKTPIICLVCFAFGFFYLCDDLGLQFIIHPRRRNVSLAHRDSEVQYYECLLSQEREVTGIHSLFVIKFKLYKLVEHHFNSHTFWHS